MSSNEEDEYPIVIGVDGDCMMDAIDSISEQLIESTKQNESLFTEHGEYVISCCWWPGQFDEYGRCEAAPYWDFTVISFQAY